MNTRGSMGGSGLRVRHSLDKGLALLFTSCISLSKGHNLSDPPSLHLKQTDDESTGLTGWLSEIIHRKCLVQGYRDAASEEFGTIRDDFKEPTK